jgi:two-component system sensor histidine kinase/response regulator
MTALGQWSDIQEKAHTVRGVAGYIGSLSLMHAAEKLENALKNDLREEAADHLASFLSALEAILSSLSALPAAEREQFSAKSGSPAKEVMVEEVEEALQLLIDQLQRGEVAAEDQFVEIENLLAGTGLDKQLHAIALLIEDIEYERAAEMVTDLLNMLRQKPGTAYA